MKDIELDFTIGGFKGSKRVWWNGRKLCAFNFEHLVRIVLHIQPTTETLQLSAGEVCVLNYITYTASGAYNRYWRKGSKR